MMPAVRSLLLAALLPLFAGCQLFGSGGGATPVLSGQTRMQGTLQAIGSQLVFAPCDSARTFVVEDNSGAELAEEASELGAVQGGLFADLRGRFDGTTIEGTPGKLNLQRLYRLERTPGACRDSAFKPTRFYAQGQNWAVRASANGMMLTRQGQPDLAVPYVIEQMPGAGSSLSSEANNQRIELWLAPQRCADGARVSYLTAELRIGDQVQRGCAYTGGAQED